MPGGRHCMFTLAAQRFAATANIGRLARRYKARSPLQAPAARARAAAPARRAWRAPGPRPAPRRRRGRRARRARRGRRRSAPGPHLPRAAPVRCSGRRKGAGRQVYTLHLCLPFQRCECCLPLEGVHPTFVSVRMQQPLHASRLQCARPGGAATAARRAPPGATPLVATPPRRGPAARPAPPTRQPRAPAPRAQAPAQVGWSPAIMDCAFCRGPNHVWLCHATNTLWAGAPSAGACSGWFTPPPLWCGENLITCTLLAVSQFMACHTTTKDRADGQHSSTRSLPSRV